MLADFNVIAMVAVNDLASGKEFYGKKLGLKQTDENPGGITYTCGGSRLFMYQSPTAGTGQATCATWEVTDIESVVAELKNKGVNFEHYDIPGAQSTGDIMTMGPMKAAWFKDPDGNILGISNKF